MANRISGASGNWSSASAVWRDVSTLGAQITGTASTGLSTTALDTPVMAGNNDQIDGVLLELVSRPGSSGTITVDLRVSGGASVQSRTLDVADLPGTSSEGGWIFVRWASNQTLSSGTNYILRLSASASNLVNMRVASAGGGDWNRLFRKTGFVAVAAADRIWVVGEYTGQADPQPSATITVTMNNNSATAYGQLDIGAGGILTYDTGANTELRIAGNINVWGLGELDMGTSGARIGSSFIADLKLVLTAEGQYGLTVYSGATFRMYGATKTNFKCKLAQNAAAAATTVITDLDNSGWAAGGSGDLILLVSTKRTGNGTAQSEVKRISSIADHGTYGETLTIESGLVFAKDGIAPFQCDVYNLSRNCRLRPSTAVDPLGGGSSSLPPFTSGTHHATYFRCMAGSVVDLSWAYIQDVGPTPTTAGRRGLEVETTALGSFAMRNSALVNARVNGLYLASASNDNVTVEDCCFHNLALSTSPAITVTATIGAALAFRRNFFVCRSTSNSNVVLNDCGLVFTDNLIVGGFHACTLAETISDVTLNMDNNESHSAAFTGLLFTAAMRNITLSGWKIWRCGESTVGASSGGIYFSSQIQNTIHSIDFINCVLFGNYRSISINNSAHSIRFFGCAIHGDTGYTSASAVYYSTSSGIFIVEFWNCDISGNLGAYPGRTAHTTDLDVPNQAQILQALLVGCSLGAASQVGSLQASWNRNTFVRSARHNKVADAHKTCTWAGVITRDTVYYRTATPSELLAPIVTGRKLESSPKHVAVAAGQQVTVSARVRVDTTYGNVPPRLMLRRYDAANQGGGAAQSYFAADQVIATHSGTKSAAAAPDSAGFELLTGQIAYAPAEDTVLEFFVDCEGTTGFVNVEDWAVV